MLITVFAFCNFSYLSPVSKISSMALVTLCDKVHVVSTVVVLPTYIHVAAVCHQEGQEVCEGQERVRYHARILQVGAREGPDQ